MTGAGIGLDAAARHLRACCPDLTIDSFTDLGEGDFCRAFLLNGNRVVRMPKHDVAVRALRRESCLLPVIASLLPLPVPIPELVECDAGVFTMHDCVSGVALTNEHWRTMTEPDRAALALRLGEFLRALHGVDVDTVRACDLDVVDHRADVERLRDRLNGTADPTLPAFLRQRLEASFAKYCSRTDATEHPHAVLHADVSPEHVLVDAGGTALTGVIDWTDVRIGDPARDFIFLYEDWGPDFVTLALDAYGPDDRTSFLTRVYTLYLIDQLDWTLAAADNGRPEDVEHGIALLSAGVAELDNIDVERRRQA